MRSRAKASRRAGDKITVADVCADLGISRRPFDEWWAKGKAPRCIPLPNGAAHPPIGLRTVAPRAGGRRLMTEIAYNVRV
jgi:hypothetical protein